MNLRTQKMANRVSEMLGFTKDTEGEQNGDLPSFGPKATKGTSKILIPFALIWRERESNPRFTIHSNKPYKIIVLCTLIFQIVPAFCTT